MLKRILYTQKLIGLKKASSMDTGLLIVLSNKDDYTKLIQFISIAKISFCF